MIPTCVCVKQVRATDTKRRDMVTDIAAKMQTRFQRSVVEEDLGHEVMVRVRVHGHYNTGFLATPGHLGSLEVQLTLLSSDTCVADVNTCRGTFNLQVNKDMSVVEVILDDDMSVAVLRMDHLQKTIDAVDLSRFAF